MEIKGATFFMPKALSDEELRTIDAYWRATGLTATALDAIGSTPRFAPRVAGKRAEA